MPSRDVNAATRLAETSWRRDKTQRGSVKIYTFMPIHVAYAI